jgi:hypothetical protein
MVWRRIGFMSWIVSSCRGKAFPATNCKKIGFKITGNASPLFELMEWGRIPRDCLAAEHEKS